MTSTFEGLLTDSSKAAIIHTSTTKQERNMFSSNVQVEFKDLLKAHTQAKQKEYDSHAYSAGYLESLADSMFYYLPKRQQQFFLAMMQDAVEKTKVAI
jgi:hypothetical protein